MSEDCFTALSSCRSEFPWGTLPRDLSQCPVSVLQRDLKVFICIFTPRTSTLHTEWYIWMLTRVRAHTHTHSHTQRELTYIKLRDWTGTQYETLRSLELTM